MAVKKKRKWIFILYPESMPENWFEIIQQTGLEACVSPLHDKDTDVEDGKLVPKKAHYHVYVKYDGPVTKNVVMQLVESLNASHPVPCESVRGQYRYFIHLDNPEKFQYDIKDMLHINGFDIREYVDLTKTEVVKIKKELQIFIRENNIFEYSDFMDHLADDDIGSNYEVASNNTYFFDKYITSFRNRQRDKMTARVKEITNELYTIRCLTMDMNELEDAKAIKSLRKTERQLKKELKELEN